MFLPNVPGAMFIPGAMSIPESRVNPSIFHIELRKSKLRFGII